MPDISKAMQSISHALPARRDRVAEQSASTARFENLFEANSRAILGYALRRTDRPEDAADVLSEVMLTAWRRIEDVPDGNEQRLWLYAVARRALANQRRSSKRKQGLGEQLRRAVTTAFGEDLADVLARRSEFREALGALPDADREVLLLQAWEGLTTEEIASVMGLTPGTVRSRAHRARARLRAALDASDNPSDKEDA